jgi:hypothetical protein
MQRKLFTKEVLPLMEIRKGGRMKRVRRWKNTFALHLLAFAEARADDLVHGRFHQARADAFAVPVTLAILRNDTLIGLDLYVKFLDGLQKFPSGVMAVVRHCCIQIHFGALHDLQGLVDVSIPQGPFERF